jgi:ATP-dependent DNA helicase RecQ
MKELCETQISQGEKEFRERIITYFTSKYAIDMYLPAATEKGTKENTAIVREYISYIFSPPDGLGGQIDNAKHLRGACDNIRIGLIEENASIDLLTSFTYFALDAKPNDTLSSAFHRPLMTQAIELYRKGFRRLLQKENWEDCKELMKYYNDKVVDINPVVKSLINPLTNELLINRTTFRLNKFLNTIS